MFMKRKNLVGMVLLAAAFGCSGESRDSEKTPSERVKESASEMADAIGDMTKEGAEEMAEQAGAVMESLSESMSKGRDAFVAEAQKQLDAMGAHIAELEKRANEASGDAKKELEAAAAKAREQTDSLKAQLDKVRNASEDAWKEAAEGFQRGYDEMKDAFRSE